MGNFFQAIFYQPILNLLVFLYNTVSFRDLGVAIVLLTIIIKLILWPLAQKSIKSQKALQDLQPKLNEIKNKYKDDKQQQSLAMMQLYKENKINPFSSCLPLLLQLPFLIAVFRVFRDGIQNKLDLVYPFIHKPDQIYSIAFGFLDLSQKNIYLAILAGLAQFWQAKMLSSKRPAIKTEGSKDEDMTAIMNKQMTYFMPIFTVFIGMSMPGGLTLYWFLTTLFTALQQLYVFKKMDKGSGNKNDKAAPTSIVEGELVK
jgi:YidC/Oxa1 family membrane protein insertase